MTATPIPRTLALTLYGDLDVSVIDELPPGRKPIITKHVEDDQVELVYSFLKKQVDHGRQAYVVYPVIEESETQAMKAAQKMHQHLSEVVFPGLPVGLLHGRLPSDEKEAVMERFKRGEVKILVSTTVIEVGVDVPNASVMVIEQAERFGLAQLHQLRGRVGRGADQSYCILVTEKLSLTRAGAHPDAGGIDRWLLHRRDGLEAARAGRVLRHAPERPARAAHRQHLARCRDPGTGPLGGHELRDLAALRRTVQPRRCLSPRPLAAPLRPGGGGLMRVIGGEFRSRRLKSLQGQALRPTPDRLREALFNVLATRLAGCTFLDAYAGCGAVGIEALSRGAARAIFIEKHRPAARVIEENLNRWASQSGRSVICGRALAHLERLQAGIVFLDPPYELEREYSQALAVAGGEAAQPGRRPASGPPAAGGNLWRSPPHARPEAGRQRAQLFRASQYTVKQAMGSRFIRGRVTGPR